MRLDRHSNYAVELTFRDERINCHPNDYQKPSAFDVSSQDLRTYDFPAWFGTEGLSLLLGTPKIVWCGNEGLTHITSAIAEMLLRASGDHQNEEGTTAPCQKS